MERFINTIQIIAVALFIVLLMPTNVYAEGEDKATDTDASLEEIEGRLDDEIVEAARQLTDQDSQDLNEMIADLVQKRHEAEEEKARFKKYLDESEKLHADLEKGYGTYVRERDNMIETAKRKANEIIENAQKKS